MLPLLHNNILSQPPIELDKCTVYHYCRFCLCTLQPRLNIIHPSDVLPFYFLNDSIVFTMPSRASTGSRPTPIARFIFSFDDT